MNACNRANHHGAIPTVLRHGARHGVDQVRRETLHKDAVPVQVSGIAGLRAPRTGSASIT